ncbi:sulfurtransferase complex subunit TusC [Ursidibacter maritimus]|uniref:Sulfurtransferase complex subunit TusC n=1 Tax=Ursidibacter maritimus TaxID=1331689 RepID=A0A949T7V7_9PAST|nr:sulfurtransferase complex subunit TusC [Ursidibacter maritimus]KAE9542169.1 sulfurtransferase [Ursidibacter maritimus]MBV6524266.1 sulfurtransferase complex subunit TusC [Ursidibacter maritimus]MBV6526533.1 sulfurtransferase complex subunit TusC [Ursidibacter maritimus]MBV6528401.1 sulfurtransferase complex subunit TusC [Ursidibacter maritimus]MBV6530290.1 sulfurtransferase complex subunit TusC [Ursidibacter maritimus]
MKKYKLAIVFTQPPFGSSTGREGLDALLAVSAFCDEDEIAIVFIYDGVFNLIAHQDPTQILQKDHIATFKLLELYELSECFICQNSLEERQLQQAEWILDELHFVEREQIFSLLHQAEKILTF